MKRIGIALLISGGVGTLGSTFGPAPGPTPPGLAPATAVVSGVLYCPSAGDMNSEHGTVVFANGGWTMLGDARVSSKTSWNLLGGFIEWDMNTSAVAPAVNTNLYTVSPKQPNCGEACYCDIQKSQSGKASCMELDLTENNGRCEFATTLHTYETDGTPSNRNCDRWGCAATQKIPASGAFHMKAAFSANGTVTVSMDGVVNPAYSPVPSASSNGVVVETMKSLGAAIESSQWFGWVPAASDCPSGDASRLASSFVTVTNVKVSGTVVQGPTPDKCTKPY